MGGGKRARARGERVEGQKEGKTSEIKRKEEGRKEKDNEEREEYVSGGGSRQLRGDVIVGISRVT
jgi:hypothetical protein